MAGTLWWYEVVSDDPNPFSSTQSSMGIDVGSSESFSREPYHYILFSSHLEGEENVLPSSIDFSSETSFFEFLLSKEIKCDRGVRLVGPCLELPIISFAAPEKTSCWFSSFDEIALQDRRVRCSQRNWKMAFSRPSSMGGLNATFVFENFKDRNSQLIRFEYDCTEGVYRCGDLKARSFNDFITTIGSRFGAVSLGEKNMEESASFIRARDRGRLLERVSLPGGGYKYKPLDKEEDVEQKLIEENNYVRVLNHSSTKVDLLRGLSPSCQKQEWRYLFENGAAFIPVFLDASEPVYLHILDPTNFLVLEVICGLSSIPNRCIFKFNSLAGVDFGRMQALFQSPNSRPEMCVKLVHSLVKGIRGLDEGYAYEFEWFWSSKEEGKGDCNLNIEGSDLILNCHRDVLEPQSSYFKDFFSGILPKTISESPERARLLVEAFYNKEKMTMENVLDCLELAVKYNFLNLQNRVFGFLSKNHVEDSLLWKALNQNDRTAFLCRLMFSLAKTTPSFMRV